MKTAIVSPFRLSFAHLIALLVSLSLVAGCNGGKSLVQPTGKITVDGNPAEGAVLLFHPAGEGSISSAVAKADGTFSPVTDAEPGIPVGSYKVTVTWPAAPAKPKESVLLSSELPEPGPDQLKGNFVNKDKSNVSVEIKSDTTEIPVIALTTK